MSDILRIAKTMSTMKHDDLEAFANHLEYYRAANGEGDVVRSTRKMTPRVLQTFYQLYEE